MAREKVKPDQLAPKIAEGFTDRPLTPEEAAREFPAQRTKDMDVSHMRGEMMPGSRVPKPTMVLIPNDAVIEEPNTGRRMKDVDQVITEDMMGAIIDRMMCLRCKEPFEIPNPINCPVCGYEVRDRQALDAGMELTGDRHVGPSKPLAEFMEDLQDRQLASAFEKKIIEGGARQRRR